MTIITPPQNQVLHSMGGIIGRREENILISIRLNIMYINMTNYSSKSPNGYKEKKPNERRRNQEEGIDITTNNHIPQKLQHQSYLHDLERQVNLPMQVLSPLSVYNVF